MPRLILISDTHATHRKLLLPAGDILLYAGDFGRHGSLEELRDFNDWMCSLPHKHKIVIAGNHDWCFELKNQDARELLTGATYLQDSEVTCFGLKIYGSPWQPRFFNWAFNLDRGEPLAQVWAKIPPDTDILITHGPPQGILDRTCSGHHAGCEGLLKRLSVLKPKLHLFGHIHEGYGVHNDGETCFVNASICDLSYRAVNTPVVFDV